MFFHTRTLHIFSLSTNIPSHFLSDQVEGEAFPTTNEDLQGFWDMIMLQVDQVDKMFRELETLKANNWVEVSNPEKVNEHCSYVTCFI